MVHWVTLPFTTPLLKYLQVGGWDPGASLDVRPAWGVPCRIFEVEED